MSAKSTNPPRAEITMGCAITPEQEVALRLVNECFGLGSIEALRFCKFLIVEKQGLEWINEGVEPSDWESAQ